MTRPSGVLKRIPQVPTSARWLGWKASKADLLEALVDACRLHGDCPSVDDEEAAGEIAVRVVNECRARRGARAVKPRAKRTSGPATRSQS